jgi:hypothetical protein
MNERAVDAGRAGRRASMSWRALYSARSVRADSPCRPGVLLEDAGRSRRMACGSSQVEVVVRHLQHAAAVAEVGVHAAAMGARL